MKSGRLIDASARKFVVGDSWFVVRDSCGILNKLDLIPAIRHIPASGVKSFVISNVRSAADLDGVGGKGPISTRFAAEAKSG